MDKVNGKGAAASAMFVMAAAVTAECIPLCCIFTLAAVAGVAYDHWAGNIKRAPRSGGHRCKAHR